MFSLSPLMHATVPVPTVPLGMGMLLEPPEPLVPELPPVEPPEPLVPELPPVEPPEPPLVPELPPEPPSLSSSPPPSLPHAAHARHAATHTQSTLRMRVTLTGALLTRGHETLDARSPVASLVAAGDS